MNILLLSNSVPAEQSLVVQMNTLGHEVFCSQEILKRLSLQISYKDILPFFDAIVFSESVSNRTIRQVIGNLPTLNFYMFRRTDLVDAGEEVVEKIQTKDGLFTVPVVHLPLNPRLEVLRDLLNDAEHQINETRNEVSDQAFPYKFFSNKERDVLNILSDSIGEAVHRETICEHVWGDDCASKSQLIQLSSIVKRIKYKLEEHGLHNYNIQTVWGKGYKLVKSV